MTNDHIFESSFRSYRQYLANQRRVRTSGLCVLSNRSTPDQSLPTPADYVIDFEMIGSAALAHLPGPLTLFRHLYLACGKFEETVLELRISRETFDVWDSRIREIVGEALRREGIWPRSRYFSGRRRADIRSPQSHRRRSMQATSQTLLGGGL